ncbi:probable glutamate receptor [Penaeus chinensis]|uniref:probable glutamate receptor n=1 Tax=Penaeus chinensis TaxID=139456 RepID=UPI001FB6C37E|nr:probable glutamate receptor [Penaeus chinensis]
MKLKSRRASGTRHGWRAACGVATVEEDGREQPDPVDRRRDASLAARGPTESKNSTRSSAKPDDFQMYYVFREDVELKIAGESSAFMNFQPDPFMKGRSIMGGPVGKLVSHLAKALNFTWYPVRPADGTFGSKMSNGSWSGVMGLVNRGVGFSIEGLVLLETKQGIYSFICYVREADMGFGPLLMSLERSEGVDFGDTLMFFNFKVMSGRGSPELNPWGFLYPLTPMVWLGLFVALVCVWLASVLLVNHALRSTWFDRVVRQFTTCLRVLLRQDIPKGFSHGREMTLVGSWMMVTMIVIMGYSSTLVSLLAARNIPQPIQSLSDLVHSDNVVILKPNSGSTTYILSSTSGIYKELGDLRLVNRMDFIKSKDRDTALDTLVRGGLHSFYDVDFSLSELISDDFSKLGRCDFYLSRESSLARPASVGVTPGSAILPALNHRIHDVLAAGLFDYWMAQAIRNSTICRKAPNTITVRAPLSLKVCWGMFTVWAVGLLLALLTFSLEIVAANAVKGRAPPSPENLE